MLVVLVSHSLHACNFLSLPLGCCRWTSGAGQTRQAATSTRKTSLKNLHNLSRHLRLGLQCSFRCRIHNNFSKLFPSGQGSIVTTAHKPDEWKWHHQKNEDRNGIELRVIHFTDDGKVPLLTATGNRRNTEKLCFVGKIAVKLIALSSDRETFNN